LLRIEEEAPLKDQKIAVLEQRVSNLEKENDLLKQQNVIQEKLTELANREAEVYWVAFEKEKELTDRALKLAEVGKPKLNWELQGVLGLAVFNIDSWPEDNEYEYPGIIRTITFLVQLISCFRTYVPSVCSCRRSV
jgi:hypothetical protein